MNRNYRKNKRNDKLFKGSETTSAETGRKSCEIRIYREVDGRLKNRCCLVRPKQKDFGQLTEVADNTTTSEEINASPSPDKYSSILAEQYGFSPLIPGTINEFKELKKALYSDVQKVENSSQYFYNEGVTLSKFMDTSDGTHWQNIDTAEDIDKFISDASKDAPLEYRRVPKNVNISEIPRVKIIAAKFSKYKQDNIELRRLEEKVACVEYDVYDRSSIGDLVKPVQKMRAFFSIKPVYENGGELPLNIKNNFNIDDDDLKNLTQKEIEIIDSKIEENRDYLEDLKRILKRKQFIDAKKNKSSLDLKSLYEMAKREIPPADSELSVMNFLSKAELQEIKDLILEKCTSSMHGICRKRIKSQNDSKLGVGLLSGSIVAELLREDAKMDVFK